MNKIAQKMQRLSQRAAQVAQAVEAMPAKAAALREKVAATVEQAQQIRTELVSGASTLRPVAETETAASLREIEAASDVLEAAGYELVGVDVEPGFGGMGRRLLARLSRIDAIKPAELRELLATHKDRPVAKALLTALVQAAEIADGVEFRNLDFTEVVADVGAGRAARILWRAEQVAPEGTFSSAVAAADSKSPTFSQSTFFARPAGGGGAGTAAGGVSAGIPVQAEISSGSPAVSPKTPAAAAATATNPDWRASALDRFKKMPDLGKRSAG